MSLHQENVSACNICAETFNRKTRTPVRCSHCEFNACRTCCERFFLSNNHAELRCMNTNCNKTWSRAFICEHFTKKFLTQTLRDHRESIFLELQRAMLPATMPIVERAIRAEQLEQQYSDNIHEYRQLRRESAGISGKIKQMQESIKAGYTSITKEELAAFKAQSKTRRQQISNRLRELHLLQQNIRYELRTGRAPAQGEQEDEATRHQQRFVRACPAEECRGYLSTAWKCGLCQRFTCKDCHVIKNDSEDHVCKEEDKATAELLVQNTKPCPSCATGIFKVDGCNVMYCTNCHTAFHWRTGELITRDIHNPHYFEYMRQREERMRQQGHTNNNNNNNNNNQNRALCQGEQGRIRTLAYQLVSQIKRELHARGWNDMERRFDGICRATLHMVLQQVPLYRIDLERGNEQLRVQFLRGYLSEAVLKKKLQQRHKDHEKRTEILNILTTFCDSVVDILEHLHAQLSASPLVLAATARPPFEAILNEVDVLTEFCNDALRKVSEMYHSVCLCIDLKSVDPLRSVKQAAPLQAHPGWQCHFSTA